MSRSLNLPTRLQVLNFFLLIDDVVHHVIERLKEPTPSPEKPAAPSESMDDFIDNVQEAINGFSTTLEQYAALQAQYAGLVSSAPLGFAAPFAPLVVDELHAFSSPAPLNNEQVNAFVSDFLRHNTKTNSAADDE